MIMWTTRITEQIPTNTYYIDDDDDDDDSKSGDIWDETYCIQWQIKNVTYSVLDPA